MVDQPLVQDAELLLKQMKGLPKRVLAAVPLARRSDFIAAIDALTENANEVQTEEDLLSLADGIHRLVEGESELQALLLPDGRNVAPTEVARQVTPEDHQKTSGKNEYAQKRAAQIRNSVIDCSNTLKEVLRRETTSKEKS
jgi:hypothetical protein